MNRFFIVQLLTIMLLLFYAVPNYVMPLLEPLWLQPGKIKFQTLRSQGVANILAEQLNSQANKDGSNSVNLDDFPYAVKVQTFSELNLTKVQLSTLKQNNFWVHPETLYSYKLLANNQVLVIGNPDTPNEASLSHSQREIKGTVFLLIQKFNQTPIEQWDTLTQQLTTIFRYPIEILSIDDLLLTRDEIKQLQQGQLLTQTTLNDHEYGSGIDRFYQQLSNGSVLSGGPIAPFITDKLIIGNFSILLSIGMFNALILLLSLLPTWRSTHYLNQITSKFRAQDYTSRMPTLFASLLNPQARTFNLMAQRTEQLFCDNQQLIYTSSKALKQPLDKIEQQLEKYKKGEQQNEALDQMEQSVNDMRDITSLILLIGKFNREKDNCQYMAIEFSEWINKQAQQWQIKLDSKLTVINHSASDIESGILTYIEPYYLDKAILSMLRLSTQAPHALELHLIISQQVSQVTIYQSDHETDTKMLTNLNEKYLLLLAQQYKGQILRNHSNGTITLEIPNVLS
ncbi:HAMP domain-containing histidine kinase [Moritella sp. 36]|uniref:HAMP domain-containing histidine kinase n=1 Tax=Moritella sp. 36 TaxID=2746233 RepID=UPI001BA6A0E9|nr:HAMP domain-containing histidine kinase [Moritella sp. 36]QUM90545.1 HAMP domain-containing histidine kinase [Moritella sp. 36]